MPSEPRKFPPPWRVEDNGSAYLVKSREGVTLAACWYAISSGGDLNGTAMTKAEARIMARWIVRTAAAQAR